MASLVAFSLSAAFKESGLIVNISAEPMKEAIENVVRRSKLSSFSLGDSLELFAIVSI